jgi:hypothetical protein
MTSTEQAEKVTNDDVLGAQAQARGGELTRRPERTGLGEFQLAVRRMLGLEDASDGEIELFWHLSQKSGLDPFNREIYMIGRNTEVAFYVKVNPDDPNSQQRKEMRWVTKYTVQVAINGFRKRAREIADAKGIKLGMSTPLWCGEDGVWREVWPEKNPPLASKFTVYRDGEPFTFVAHFSEFSQTKSGGGLTAMWEKMQANQIRKCAEANAIQMAFPDELGGLILEDAAQPDIIIDSDGNDVRRSTSRPAQRGRGTSGLRDAAAADADTPPTTESEPPAAAQQGMSEETRRKWLNRMFQLLGEGKCDKREDQLIVIAAVGGLPIGSLEHRDALTDDQLREAVNGLNRWKKNNALADEIREVINTAAIDAAQAAAADNTEESESTK